MYRLRYYLYRNRYALRRVYFSLITGLIFAALITGLIYEPTRRGIFSAAQKVAAAGVDLALRCGERDPRGLMRAAIPALAWSGGGEDVPELLTPRSLLTALLAPFRVDIRTPLDLIRTEIPLLAAYNPEAVPVSAEPEPPGPDPEKSAALPSLTEKALVGIYHTHTGETYALTDGTERLTGKKGGVVTVGESLKKELEEVYGIRTVHSDRINDEKYSASYTESEKDARRLLAENPDLEILLDIHRDAGKPRKDSIVDINGREMAPILFVVGSDARAPFPTWKQNYDFAKKLAEQIGKKYPGLCTGVRVKEGRYNQFLHPRAILVEVGSVSNSTEEAVESGRLLAGILAGELKAIVPDQVKPVIYNQGSGNTIIEGSPGIRNEKSKPVTETEGVEKTGTEGDDEGKNNVPTISIESGEEN